MTPYEYGDIAQSAFANANASFALMLTVISAYLIVAYTVGDRLTTVQLWVLNVLFIVTSVFIAFLVIGFSSTGVRLAGQANPQVTRESFFAARQWTVMAAGLINVLGIGGALYFMFDKRRSN